MLSRKSLSDRLSAFGAQAAQHPDVDELLATACKEVADAVGVSHVKVLEDLPEELAMLVRAGVGWRDGIVGNTKIPAGLDSAAGFTLQTGKPMLANDLDNEDRFRIPEFLREHGIKSAANVLIKSGDFVFGVLEADSLILNYFKESNIDVLQAFANILALAISQSKLAAENYALSKKLDLSLQELAHRIKNNNNMLLSMVNLQKRNANLKEISQALSDISNRIMVMTAVDDFLDPSDEVELIDVPSYAGAIAERLFSQLSDSSMPVRVTTEFQDGYLPRNQAQSVGIIINEFVTNSFKYAFKDGGELSARISFEGDDAILVLSDDGPGIADNVLPGLGMQIIEAIAGQLGGEARWLKGEGACLRVTFPRGGGSPS
jgi:two-component sensor histidine kinase